MTSPDPTNDATLHRRAKQNRRFVFITLVLCILMLYLNGILSDDISTSFRESPVVVGLISAALLCYAYVALRRPATGNIEAMSAGLRWGVAVGCVWLAFVTIEPSGWPFAVLLPILCGALGAIRTGKVRGAACTGLWCGVASGLLGFLVFATRSNLAALFPRQFRQINPADEIGTALFILIVYGLVLCPVVSTIGGLIGLPLERTGRIAAPRSNN